MGSIGTLERLRVGHDNSGLAPGWYLLSVTVEEMTSGQKSEMRVDRWFAKDEDDKMIMRDIYCGEGFQQDTTAGGMDMLLMFSNLESTTKKYCKVFLTFNI